MAMKPSSADIATKQTKPRNTSSKNVRRSRDEKPIRYAEIFKENNIETNRAIGRALIEINQKINENQ